MPAAGGYHSAKSGERERENGIKEEIYALLLMDTSLIQSCFGFADTNIIITIAIVIFCIFF